MRKLNLLIIIIVLALLLTGCGFSQYKSDAGAVITKYFEAVNDGDFAAALDFYTPDFFENVSKSDMQHFLESRNNELGDMQKYWIISWRVHQMEFIGGPDKGRELISCHLVIKVTYSSGSAIEKYILKRDEETGEFAISWYDDDYPGYLLFRLLPF
jgi:ketosteroid isomerase-like protein